MSQIAPIIEDNVPEAKQGTDRETLKPLFLLIFENERSIDEAAKIAGISPRTVVQWTELDPKFAHHFNEIKKAFGLMAEDELLRRGVRGVDEYIIYKGERIPLVDENGEYILDEDYEVQYLKKTNYSDKCLEMYLRANNPKYRKSTSMEFGIESGGETGPARKISVKFIKSNGDGGALGEENQHQPELPFAEILEPERAPRRDTLE